MIRPGLVPNECLPAIALSLSNGATAGVFVVNPALDQRQISEDQRLKTQSVPHAKVAKAAEEFTVWIVRNPSRPWRTLRETI